MVPSTCAIHGLAGRVLLAVLTLLPLVAAPSVSAAPPTREVDLQVSISDSPDPVAAGEELTYAVAVTNAGQVAAEAVTLSVTASPEVVSVTASQGTCGGAVECALGTIAKRASATVSIVVRADPRYPSASARVTSNGPESSTGDNEAVTTTTITGGPSSGVLSECTYSFPVGFEWVKLDYWGDYYDSYRACRGQNFVLTQRTTLRVRLQSGPGLTGRVQGYLYDAAWNRCGGGLDVEVIGGIAMPDSATAVCEPGTYFLRLVVWPKSTPQVYRRVCITPIAVCRDVYFRAYAPIGSFGGSVTEEQGA